MRCGSGGIYMENENKEQINPIEFENMLEAASSFFTQMSIVDMRIGENRNTYKYLIDEDIPLLEEFILEIKKIEDDFINAKAEEKMEIFNTIKKYSVLSLDEIIQQCKIPQSI